MFQVIREELVPNWIHWWAPCKRDIRVGKVVWDGLKAHVFACNVHNGIEKPL